jgi:heme exporter protein D
MGGNPRDGETMIWHSFDEFLHMGGYGLYVWGSYGVTFAAFAAEVVLARKRHRRAFAEAARAAKEAT